MRNFPPEIVKQSAATPNEVFTIVKAELRYRFKHRWKVGNDGSNFSRCQRINDVAWLRTVISWLRQN